jgi:hypothetical protein
LRDFSQARLTRYYQAQNEAAKQRFIAGGIASWHEHQERKVTQLALIIYTCLTAPQGGNTRQLLQKEIEEEHRAAAVELVLRRRAMIKELYSRESQQYRCCRSMWVDLPASFVFAGLNWQIKVLFLLTM